MIRAPTSGITCSGSGKDIGVRGIEAARDLPGELDVLALVVPDRHLIRLVQQDVRRLQHRIEEQARAHQRLLARRLVLELVHALEVAVRGDRAEQPGEL
jgi:hypothetical protein